MRSLRNAVSVLFGLLATCLFCVVSYASQEHEILPDEVPYEYINNCGDGNIAGRLFEDVESYISLRKQEVDDIFHDKTDFSKLFSSEFVFVRIIFYCPTLTHNIT